MKTWQALYAMIWLSYATTLIALFDVIPFREYIHALPALAMVVLAFRNKFALQKKPCPDRIKRIAGGTAGLCVGMAVTGVLMAIPQIAIVKPGFEFLHITFLVAIIAQSGSMATAYDMFGEKEFLIEAES